MTYINIEELYKIQNKLEEHKAKKDVLKEQTQELIKASQKISSKNWKNLLNELDTSSDAIEKFFYLTETSANLLEKSIIVNIIYDFSNQKKQKEEFKKVLNRYNETLEDFKNFEKEVVRSIYGEDAQMKNDLFFNYMSRGFKLFSEKVEIDRYMIENYRENIEFVEKYLKINLEIWDDDDLYYNYMDYIDKKYFVSKDGKYFLSQDFDYITVRELFDLKSLGNFNKQIDDRVRKIMYEIVSENVKAEDFTRMKEFESNLIDDMEEDKKSSIPLKEYIKNKFEIIFDDFVIKPKTLKYK